MDLTPRQQQVVTAIRTLTAQCRHPPTNRELMVALGIKSPNGIHCHLKALRRKGVVEWVDGAARSMWVVGDPSPVAVLEWVSRDGGFAGLSPETRDAVLGCLGVGTIC